METDIISLLDSGLTWMTKEGLRTPNYWGSLTQSSSVRLGHFDGEEVYCPFNALMPMAHPDNIVLGGWDISGMKMDEAMQRARVIDFELQRQLVPLMKDMPAPLPGAN